MQLSCSFLPPTPFFGHLYDPLPLSISSSPPPHSYPRRQALIYESDTRAQRAFPTLEQDAGGRGDCGAISGGGDGSHGSGRRCLTATINYPQEGPASLEEKREKAQTCQVKKEAQKFCRETARKSLLVGERNWRNLILRLIYFLFLAPNERAWWVGEKGGGCWREEA